MSTAELDPISRACRLLREGAAELKNCHTLAATGHDWTGEPAAKAIYDEHMATADALERWADSIGAGGVESLRGRQCLHRISEPAGEYPALPDLDGTLWRAIGQHRKADTPAESSAAAKAVDTVVHTLLRAYVDADRAMRAAQSENLHCKSTQKRLATQWGFVPAGAQQPGTAGLVGALEDAQRAINSMKVEAETAAQGDEQMMLEACETISNEGLQADMAIRAALASHGQAPARADMQDAYVGAREDLAIWKRRALEAERDLRAERETASRLAAEINAINGPTHLGEPAPTAQPAPAATPQADSQPAPVPDMAVMQLAESVGLIGPASRTHDLHAAIQRFHDLICANATIKAAAMAAEVISVVSVHQWDTGYPPLPKPNIQRGGFPNLFTEGQMRAYVDADRAAQEGKSHG